MAAARGPRRRLEARAPRGVGRTPAHQHQPVHDQLHHLLPRVRADVCDVWREVVDPGAGPKDRVGLHVDICCAGPVPCHFADDRRIIYAICCFLVPFCLFWGATFPSSLYRRRWVWTRGVPPECGQAAAIGGAGVYGLPTLFCDCRSCGGGRWLIMPRQKLFRLWVVIRVLYAGLPPRLRGASSSACPRSRTANDRTGSLTRSSR